MGVLEEQEKRIVFAEDHPELFEGLRDERSPSMGGVVRDVLYASHLSTEALFELAKVTTFAWFGLSKKVVSMQKEISGKAFPTIVHNNVTEKLLNLVEGGLDVANKVAIQGLTTTENFFKTPGKMMDNMLASRGSQRGDTIRYLFNDTHTKEALLCVFRLLGTLGVDLSVRNPLKLLVGARNVAKMQAYEKSLRVKQRQEMLALSHISRVDQEMIEMWQLMIHFALAAYGVEVLSVIGLLPSSFDQSRMSRHKAAIVAMTGVQAKDVLKTVAGGDMYHPGHYVALDHKHKHVVVSIRGSLSIHDILVDLVCEQVPYTFFDRETGQTIEGKIHRGFYITAKRIAAELEPLITDALAKYSEYELIICGHSLGSAIAAALALEWYQQDKFVQSKIHAYGFGAPCVLCHDLAQNETIQKLITSVVLDDDFVSRLNFSTVQELQKRIVALADADTLQDEEIQEIYSSIAQEPHENKLFSIGRVWLLESGEFGYHPYPIQINPMQFTHELQISTSFLTLHLPHNYLNAIQKL